MAGSRALSLGSVEVTRRWRRQMSDEERVRERAGRKSPCQYLSLEEGGARVGAVEVPLGPPPVSTTLKRSSANFLRVLSQI